MDGELDEASTELVRRHMGVCEECTLKFAALEDQEEQLARALVHDPGEEFFESFAADVERQLPPGKESGSKPRTSPAVAPAAALRPAAASKPPPASIPSGGAMPPPPVPPPAPTSPPRA